MRPLAAATFAAGFARLVRVELIGVAAFVRSLTALPGNFALLLLVHAGKATTTLVATLISALVAALVALSFGFTAFAPGCGMLLRAASTLVSLFVFVALAAGLGVLLRAAATGVFLIFCHE
jgi:hypothetical protein